MIASLTPEKSGGHFFALKPYRPTMCPEESVNHVTGMDLERMVARGGIEPPTRGFSVAWLVVSGFIYQ